MHDIASSSRSSRRGVTAVLVAALATIAAAQQAQEPKSEVTLLKAGLGSCAADFMVRDEAGRPAYNATVHVRVRYGAFGIKRSDLEVGTNADGKARIEGLPTKAKPLVYEIEKGTKKAVVQQDVGTTCRAAFDVRLK